MCITGHLDVLGITSCEINLSTELYWCTIRWLAEFMVRWFQSGWSFGSGQFLVWLFASKIDFNWLVLCYALQLLNSIQKWLVNSFLKLAHLFRWRYSLRVNLFDLARFSLNNTRCQWSAPSLSRSSIRCALPSNWSRQNIKKLSFTVW